MGDSYLAEDVLQEVFLYVAKNFSKIHRENCHELAAYLVSCSRTAPNQLYGTDNCYLIQGASEYLKGNIQLSQIEEGEKIVVDSNGKVLLSDPYQFDSIYSIRLQ